MVTAPSESPIRSPRSADEITPAWMTEVLSADFPGVNVTAVGIEEQIIGSAVKTRVRLSCLDNAAGRGAPETVIVKASFGRYGLDQEAASVYPEIHAYNHVVPKLEVNAPACFHSGIDRDGRGVIVMEDLRKPGAVFCSVLRPFSYDQAAAMLDQCAAIHARWWESPDLGPTGALSFIPETLENGDGAGVQFFIRQAFRPERWAEVLTWPRAHAAPRAYRDLDTMVEAMERLRVVWRGLPHCVVHGDEHLGNMFIDPQGRPGLLDWQTKKAPWAEAFAYLVAGALDIEDRRRWEWPLLEHYLERLAAYGAPAPSFADAQLAYRQAILFGLFVWFRVGPDPQPEINCVASVTRFGLAVLDHDTLGALGM